MSAREYISTRSYTSWGSITQHATLKNTALGKPLFCCGAAPFRRFFEAAAALQVSSGAIKPIMLKMHNGAHNCFAERKSF